MSLGHIPFLLRKIVDTQDFRFLVNLGQKDDLTKLSDLFFSDDVI